MDYKVFIFDTNWNERDELSRILASQNCQITCLCFTNETDKLEDILSCQGNLLLLCKNQDIDDLISKNINKLSNDKIVVDEQAVVFKKEESKIIFLPYDADWSSLLAKINLNSSRASKTCQFKLFGLQRQNLDQTILQLQSQIQDFQATVLECGLLKYEVYISYSGSDDLIDNNLVKIATAFGNFVYSDNSLDMSESIISLARLKGLRLAVCEGVSGGALLKELCMFEQVPLVCGKIEFCDGPINPDNVYNQTLNLFENGQNDIFAVNIQGEFVDGQLNCVYAIGNNKSVDVHKNTFKTNSRKSSIQFALNAIMFNIIKKLRQNSLSF